MANIGVQDVQLLQNLLRRERKKRQEGTNPESIQKLTTEPTRPDASPIPRWGMAALDSFPSFLKAYCE